MTKIIEPKKIETYIRKCFEEAARSEQRILTEMDYSPEFILYEKEELGKKRIYFIPIFHCKYQRVMVKVKYRLNRNLEKNFDVIPDDYMRLCKRNTFGEVADPNHAIARFEVRGKQLTLCDGTINHDRLPYHDIPMKDIGQEMDVTSRLYYWEKMTFTRYKDLYAKTYGSWPDRHFMVSSGVTILEK